MPRPKGDDSDGEEVGVFTPAEGGHDRGVVGRDPRHRTRAAPTERLRSPRWSRSDARSLAPVTDRCPGLIAKWARPLSGDASALLGGGIPCDWVGKAGRTLVCPVQGASSWTRAAGSLEVVW